MQLSIKDTFIADKTLGIFVSFTFYLINFWQVLKFPRQFNLENEAGKKIAFTTLQK